MNVQSMLLKNYVKVKSYGVTIITLIKIAEVKEGLEGSLGFP